MKRLTRQTMVAGLLAGAVVARRYWDFSSRRAERDRSRRSPEPQPEPFRHPLAPCHPENLTRMMRRPSAMPWPDKSLLENCLICHTEDVIAGQRLTPVQWKAEVEQDGQVGFALAEGGRHPADRLPGAPLFGPIGTADSHACRAQGRGFAGGARLRSGAGSGRRRAPTWAQLYTTNCATCHGPTALGGDLGPSLVSKAVLDHPKEYDQIVRQGRHRMPGFQAVLKGNDQADVLAWLRGRTYPE